VKIQARKNLCILGPFRVSFDPRDKESRSFTEVDYLSFHCWELCWLAFKER